MRDNGQRGSRRLNSEEEEMALKIEDSDGTCSNPCDATEPCSVCEPYWDRMRSEGLWVDGRGWTDKALQEWKK